PPRVAIGARADERLHLDEDRPRALDAAEYGGAWRSRRALREKQHRRVRHRTQPRPCHLEHTELAHRAEAVLDRANHAMRVMPLALEVQDRIDDMLERFGAGEAAVFRDVADED